MRKSRETWEANGNAEKLSERMSDPKMYEHLHTPEMIEKNNEAIREWVREHPEEHKAIIDRAHRESGTLKYYEDLSLELRSSWEAKFARLCSDAGVEWQYEPKTFETPHGNYTPDFYLPEHGVWVEIKGTPHGKTQFRKIRYLQEEMDLHVLMDKALFATFISSLVDGGIEHHE